MNRHIDVTRADCPTCDGRPIGEVTAPDEPSDVRAWTCDSCGESWEVSEVMDL